MKILIHQKKRDKRKQKSSIENMFVSSLSYYYRCVAHN